MRVTFTSPQTIISFAASLGPLAQIYLDLGAFIVCAWLLDAAIELADVISSGRLL